MAKSKRVSSRKLMQSLNDIKNNSITHEHKIARIPLKRMMDELNPHCKAGNLDCLNASKELKKALIYLIKYQRGNTLEFNEVEVLVAQINAFKSCVINDLTLSSEYKKPYVEFIYQASCSLGDHYCKRVVRLIDEKIISKIIG